MRGTAHSPRPMFSVLWALLLPFALGSNLMVDVTMNTPGTQWSSGWSSVTGTQSFGGTIISAGGVDATLTYKFTGTAISVYGTEGTSSQGQRANSSYTLDGSTPHIHQESGSVATSNVLFYSSPTLVDTQHTLVIKNLVDGGELQLDYFQVTGTAQGRGSTQTPSPSGDSGSLQPGTIAGLVVASVAVLVGFILLFILWRRHYVRERKGKSEMYPKLQVESQDDAQSEPFLNEPTRIEPFPSVPSSQPSLAPTSLVMTVTPLRPRPSREQAATTSTSHRDEKRLLPASLGYTTESISRLNLGLDVNPRDHSVVGQPSNYESEANAVPPHHRNRENDGGVSLLGSSETINPKALRLPPDYRQFCP